MNPPAAEPATLTHDEFVPATAAELSRFLAENAAGPRQPVCPVGGRTALGYGYPPPAAAVTVSTARLAGVVDYPARDMTVTVEAGIRVDRLAEFLAAERQQLPIDIAQSHRATIGGAVATNTSGPRRFGHGTLRDYVIGISAADGRGRLFKAGGRVVKNVAGYDLCKLLVGSLGTLAVVTQVTLKLRPLPETSSFVWASFDALEDVEAALSALTTSGTRPVVLDVLNADAARLVVADARLALPADRPALLVGVEGTERETAWQTDRLRNESAPHGPRSLDTLAAKQAESLRLALTEFQVLADEPVIFKANLLPSRTVEFAARATSLGVAVQAHAGNGIVVGKLPDAAASVEKAEQIVLRLRQLTQQARGNLVILECPADWKRRLRVFGDPEPAWPLMRRIKAALDPCNLLNQGRFFDTADDVFAKTDRQKDD
ncbi:MAG TPA: FAD-binding oxidoreductase [Planctomycetaceae bacterium]|nr:FAD-binding oxidoreductase [Planctomycetaceae bacterium]